MVLRTSTVAVAVAVALCSIASHEAEATSILARPSLPLTASGVAAYLGDFENMWSEFYAGADMLSTFEHLFDPNIIVCADANVCSVGIDAAVDNLVQFQGYIDAGWLTPIASSVSVTLVRFGDTWVVFEQSGTFRMYFPGAGATAELAPYFNTEFTVAQTSNNTFNASEAAAGLHTGKIIQMRNVYADDADADAEAGAAPTSTTTTTAGVFASEVRGALFRLFASLKTEAEAKTEVAARVANGVGVGGAFTASNGVEGPAVSHAVSSSSSSSYTTGKNRDVFIVLGVLSPILVLIGALFWCCYKKCCCGCVNAEKKKRKRPAAVAMAAMSSASVTVTAGSAAAKQTTQQDMDRNEDD